MPDIRLLNPYSRRDGARRLNDNGKEKSSKKLINPMMAYIKDLIFFHTMTRSI
jgi:hypothetical protein